MNTIVLPIDTKSLYFNIKNDNKNGHTPTVASPLKKIKGDQKLEDVFLLKNKEVDITDKGDLIDLLIKHSKTKVIIRKVYEFNKISVNGHLISCPCSFGFYIKEEVDETKVQFGRLKLHYPSKFIYQDGHLSINNKEVYKTISKLLCDYAFIVNSFEYSFETDTLNFDVLVVGENNIPYSKVFINEKGVGNKFNPIFNENADDYDREIIALRTKFGDEVNPYNFAEYINKLKISAIDFIKEQINNDVKTIYDEYPYSLFDFVFNDDGIKKYGLLRFSATKNKYFNLSLMQQIFMMNYKDDANIYLITDILGKPKLDIISFDELSQMGKTINSLKYEDD